MEIKKYSKQTIDNAIVFLYENSRNTSKAKSALDILNRTPKEEGYGISDFIEIDICFSKKYSSCFVKVFFGNKTFRHSISVYEVSKWYSVQYSMAIENVSNNDFDIEEEL